MSEKRSLNFSTGETPEFLKSSKLEKEPGFIRLADVIEGFSGRAKITEQMWRAMFPERIALKNKLFRIGVLKRVIERDPNIILKTSKDLALNSVVSVPELHGVDNERRIRQAEQDEEVTRLLTDLERKVVVNALAGADDGAGSEDRTKVFSSDQRARAKRRVSKDEATDRLGNGEPTMVLDAADFEPLVDVASARRNVVPQADLENPTGFLKDDIAVAQREYLRGKGVVPAALASLVGAERKAAHPAARRESPRSGVRASAAIPRVQPGSGSHSLLETPDDATMAFDRSDLPAGLADFVEERGVNKEIIAKDFFTVPKRDG